LLTGQLALDAVTTNHYGANCAWMQLAILAHNLSSMKTLRFTLINRAARVVKLCGYKRLRFPQHPATQHLYARAIERLVA
jgi:hypothetical protein